MKIHLAKSDEEVIGCFPVMSELRPQLVQNEFVARIRSLERQGYLLAYLQESAGAVAVAGFHLGESLAWGKFLYIEDLVTLPTHRSRGFGTALLSWLNEFAANKGCEQLHLDSGVQRVDAHRFYEREGMTRASYHFAKHVFQN